MNHKRDFDRAVDRWWDDGSDATPPEVIDAVLLAVRTTPQERDFRISWRASPMKRLPYAVAAVAALAVSGMALSALSAGFGIGSGPTPSEEPSVDLGIFERVAGRIVYGDRDGIWGVDPAAPADPATRVQLTTEAGIPLGWSSDGTRLLIMQSRGEPVSSWAPRHLFVLHADGSETQVTERPMSIRGATISPDGSRVVFAGGAGTPRTRVALYAVDADGGRPGVLREGHGLIQRPTFSPDGTRIAYVDGGGDHGHSVWLMDADGSDPHQILSNERTAAVGHVHGLAWSPAGDRIALELSGGAGRAAVYTFGIDGSDFTLLYTGAFGLYWSPDGSRIAYTRGFLEIADADGSNRLRFRFGAAGPWHPGTPENDVGG